MDTTTKILIVTQHYWPENFRITDVAETFASAGHQVTVLCGLPNYPKGYIFGDYKKGLNRFQIHNNVRIIRAKEIARKHNIISRFLNYYSFPFYANRIVKRLADDYDVILINELSPIMSAKPGFAYAKKHGKKVVMYEMDLWPESLLAGGIKKNSFIYNHYKKVSSKIYSKCDKILVSTKEHIEYIRALPNCSNLDIDYLPQYAESIFEEENYENIDNDVIDLMFAGNIGKAQSVDTIIKAASLLKDNSKIKFHIVGGGSELENVKKLATELKLNNVEFYGQRPLSEMPELYRLADVMLVSLEDKPYANMTIPGKVQSYMAAGKPVIGAVNGSCANFIINNEIGYTCPSGDYNALVDIIKNLSLSELDRIGKNSKEKYKTKYNKEKFITTLIRNLEEFANKQKRLLGN
ncbi:MAG: glycosyltransferase family 4 protein [Bacilli bacterium]|nr:glycosyltransferase family 4 protein [Bacilli bacterium]